MGLIDKIAAIEHEQWMEWAKVLMGSEALSQERIDRWEEYMVPYEELSEEARGHDRKWAKAVMELVMAEVAGSAAPPPVARIIHLRAVAVPSESNPDISYIVVLEPFFWCGCRDFRFKGPERMCKHLQDAIEWTSP